MEIPVREDLEQNDIIWMETHGLISIPLQPPSLSDVASVLQNGMSTRFREVDVDVVNCPPLNREPFNLAGIGLCGNTSIIKIGHELNFYILSHRHTSKWDIGEFIYPTCYDSFVIGSGYAAQPYMPHNGHLIINARSRALGGITNASRIVYAEGGNGQIRTVTLTEPNQMTCSFMGNAFVSNGREGHVLRVRAKGRETDWDIISSMQDILYNHYLLKRNYTGVALGGVLKIRNGRVAQFVTPEQYPVQLSRLTGLARWFICSNVVLESELIAVGTLVNTKPQLWDEERYNSIICDMRVPFRHHHFNSFSNYGAGGQFINDITRDTIEYEGYFNLANNIYYTQDNIEMLRYFD